MPPQPLTILFAGAGEFGRPTLDALVAAGHRVARVVTQPDRPAGRGRKLAPTPIAQRALELDLPLLRTADINAEDLPDADALVVIAFGQKIAAPILHRPRLGALNLHASLLPRHRGAAPIHAAILAGDTRTGNAVIRLADRMDAGAILALQPTPIGPTETAGELHDRLAALGPSLILKVLDDLANGVATETPQDESAATRAVKLSRATATLDFNQPAEVVARTIRGLSPWPGCRVKLLDAAGETKARLTLLCAIATSDDERRWHPGEIALSGAIATPDGAVKVLRLQPEGGTPMTLDQYRNGHPWQPALRLQSIGAES